MIYFTGDTHGNFSRFHKKSLFRRICQPGSEDYVIVCGDFGLLWEAGRELEYNLDWFSRLPFTLLWVQGNHENYDLIAEYPIENWNGGKVRHIVRDKVILLERGQVFSICGKKIFTFGGAECHDIKDGILDPTSPDYKEKYKKMRKEWKQFRVLGKSWWRQELPNQEEMEEGIKNLEAVGYNVDYVITHCLATRMQKKYFMMLEFGEDMIVEPDDLTDSNLDVHSRYRGNILTDYLDGIEERLCYSHWFCGHYHDNLQIDEKHTILFHEVAILSENGEITWMNENQKSDK